MIRRRSQRRAAEHDVWSHKADAEGGSHTPIECESCYGRVKTAAMGRRHAHAGAGPQAHTWWSYRSPDWDRRQGPPARSLLALAPAHA
jgi:exonuclease III